MSWLRFGISAFAAALYLLPLNGSAPVRGPWHMLVAAAFLYSVPHVFIGAGRPTRDRLAVNARHRNWVVGWEDQKLHAQTAERQTGLEARRQILTWLLDGIEDLGERRIAFHLLTEAVEHLSPSAREVYRVLLSPGATEEAVRSV